MYYLFIQNPTGGNILADTKKGIGKYVWIEGFTHLEIRKRAEKIGLYFDGHNTGKDCTCCPERWIWDPGISLKPLIMLDGKPLDLVASLKFHIPNQNANGYVHKLDGRILQISTIKKLSFPASLETHISPPEELGYVLEDDNDDDDEEMDSEGN